jgi:hypothetical protein
MRALCEYQAGSRHPEFSKRAPRPAIRPLSEVLYVAPRGPIIL